MNTEQDLPHMGICSFCVRMSTIYKDGEASANEEYLYEGHLLLIHGQRK